MEPHFNFNGDSHRVAGYIRDGIQAAFHEEGLSFPTSPRRGFQDENIKIQKLVYRVAETKDIPIIRTWYRYGQFEPYGMFRPKSMTAQPMSDPRHRVPSRQNPNGISVTEIKGFFQEENLEQVWRQPLFEFLEENYKQWGPEPYRESYLANLEILRLLEKIADEQDLSGSAGEYASELKGPSLDLRYHLKSAPMIGEDATNHVSEFLDSLHTGLIGLASTNDPQPSQVHAIKRARNIYHDSIWPWPAMAISVDRARGPEGEISDFRDDGESYLRDYGDSYPIIKENWESEAIDAGLRPSPSQYQSVCGGVPDSLAGLEKTSLGYSDNE